MPIYEYRCEQCGSLFEVMQKFSDEALTVHDKCGGPVQRLISAPALQFKGSGWYITDYAKSGSSSAPGKSGNSGSSESKSDSTPAPSSTPSTSSSSSSSTTPSSSKT